MGPVPQSVIPRRQESLGVVEFLGGQRTPVSAVRRALTLPHAGSSRGTDCTRLKIVW